MPAAVMRPDVIIAIAQDKLERIDEVRAHYERQLIKLCVVLWNERYDNRVNRILGMKPMTEDRMYEVLSTSRALPVECYRLTRDRLSAIIKVAKFSLTAPNPSVSLDAADVDAMEEHIEELEVHGLDIPSELQSTFAKMLTLPMSEIIQRDEDK